MSISSGHSIPSDSFKFDVVDMTVYTYNVGTIAITSIGDEL